MGQVLYAATVQVIEGWQKRCRASPRAYPYNSTHSEAPVFFEQAMSMIVL